MSVSGRLGLTQIQGCLSASVAVTLLAGLMVSILLIRSLASGVTVSHSGEGNCLRENGTEPLKVIVLVLHMIL